MKWIALALTVLTGFTGLVYEVTWQKCLATLLGSHSEATAAVLAIFLGGLAVGYAVFGRVTLSHRRRVEAGHPSPGLLQLYGLVEAGIGLHALVFPWLFRVAQGASLWFPGAGGGAGFGFDVALSALLIGPATILMGGTVPILTQALARDLDDATRVHAHVYAFNTGGAFVGALAAGFVLVPWLGLEGVLRAMGALNLTAGVAFLALGRTRHETQPQPGVATRPETLPGLGLYALVAVLLGFAMMTTQTVLIRMGGLALGASHFTFSMVVAVFVLCIAIGSLVVSALPRIPRATLPVVVWALLFCFTGFYVVADDAPYWAHRLRTAFGSDAADFLLYHRSIFAALLAVIGVPVALSGATLPLLFDHLRHEVVDLGAVAGRLYSWNTVGNLLGALLGGSVLLLWLDLHHVYRVALFATLVAGGLISLRMAPRGRLVITALCAASGLAIVLLPGWSPQRLASGLFRAREPLPGTHLGPDALFAADGSAIPFYTDDPVASIAVKDGFHKGRPERAIVSNGKSDGATVSDYVTMGLAGLVPCLLAERCEHAFVIGYGTGVTAGELARLDRMRRVRVAEISRGVIEAAPLFDFANRQASRNPRVEIVRADAYRALLRSADRYDVIVSEPSNPWVTGVEMLFSREFLSAARAQLREGGVYGQWFHTYETDQATLEMVLRTYLDVFDDTAVWFTTGPDLLLLGFERPPSRIDLDRLLERARRSDFAAGLRRCGVHGDAELLAHELIPLGVLGRLVPSGPSHTLLHPRLSHVAARAFFRGGRAHSRATTGLPAWGPAETLLGRYLARRPRPLDDELRASLTLEYCGANRSDECGSALAWWRSEAPDSPALARAIRLTLPKDPAAAGRAETQLARLHGFYTGGPVAPLDATEAAEAAQLHRRHFLPALPFRADALDALWSACRDEPGRCEAARRTAETESPGDG